MAKGGQVTIRKTLLFKDTVKKPMEGPTGEIHWFAPADFTIEPQSKMLIPTGYFVDLEPGYMVIVAGRAGMRHFHDVTIPDPVMDKGKSHLFSG